MDPRDRCDIVTLLPPSERTWSALPVAEDLGAPTLGVVAHASATWRYRDLRVNVGDRENASPWLI